MLVALAKNVFFRQNKHCLDIPMARQLTLNDDDDDNLTCHLLVVHQSSLHQQTM